MTDQRQPDPRTDKEFVLYLAETTDVSPRQAEDLMKKHKGNRDAVLKEARNFRAES